MLTIGFARRVATYKRLDLLLRDVDRALALLGDAERPVQFLLAGKAHPRDDDGKRLVQRLFELKGHPQVGRRVVFLDDYDLALGAAMTRGCDVWVNVPRPPLEARGTSGIKSAVNGGLQLSVLDGWWPEAYDGTNGWAIGGEVDHDHGAQDWRHAAELYRLLAERGRAALLRPRRATGCPPAWLAMVRASLRTIGPSFGAGPHGRATTPPDLPARGAGGRLTDSVGPFRQDHDSPAPFGPRGCSPPVPVPDPAPDRLALALASPPRPPRAPRSAGATAGSPTRARRARPARSCWRRRAAAASAGSPRPARRPTPRSRRWGAGSRSRAAARSG